MSYFNLHMGHAVYNGINLSKGKCLSLSMGPIVSEQRRRNIPRYQQVYPNKHSLNDEGSNCMFSAATKLQSIKSLQMTGRFIKKTNVYTHCKHRHQLLYKLYTRGYIVLSIIIVQGFFLRVYDTNMFKTMNCSFSGFFQFPLLVQVFKKINSSLCHHRGSADSFLIL